MVGHNRVGSQGHACNAHACLLCPAPPAYSGWGGEGKAEIYRLWIEKDLDQLAKPLGLFGSSFVKTNKVKGRQLVVIGKEDEDDVSQQAIRLSRLRKTSK